MRASCPQDVTAAVSASFGSSGKAVDSAFVSVLRRCPNAARMTLKKSSGLCGFTGLSFHKSMRTTAESTFGAGMKLPAVTVKSFFGAP